MVAQSYASQLAIGGQAFEFVEASLGKSSTLVKSNGQRGSRTRDKNRAKIVNERCSGNLILEPSVSEIDILLPWFMGGTTETGVTPFAEALSKKTVILDKVTKVYTYAETVVGRTAIAGTPGQALRWTLDTEAQSESEGNAGSFSATAIDTDASFFTMNECALTINSVTVTPKSFNLIIDNMLDAERFLNSLTRDEIPAQDRMVSLEVLMPFDTVHEALYDLTVAGVSGSLAITDGSTTYTFAFENMKAAETPVQVPNRSEIDLSMTFEIFGDLDNDTFEFDVTKS